MKTGCDMNYEIKTVSPIPINKEGCHVVDIKPEDQEFFNAHPHPTTTYVVELTPELKEWIEEQYNLKERILKNLYQVMESDNRSFTNRITDPERDAYFDGIAKAISIIEGLN